MPSKTPIDIDNLPDVGQIYWFTWSDGFISKASFQGLKDAQLDVMEAASMEWALYPTRKEDGDPYVVGFEVADV